MINEVFGGCVDLLEPRHIIACLILTINCFFNSALRKINCQSDSCGTSLEHGPKVFLVVSKQKLMIHLDRGHRECKSTSILLFALIAAYIQSS